VKVRVLIPFILAITALAAALAPASAQAGNEFGRFAPADVTCDSITNEIKIHANIGAGEAYEKQRVAYTLYLYNATTAKWIPLTIDYKSWHVVLHERVSGYWAWTPDRGTYWQPVIDPWAPTPTLTYNQPDGRYYVYTQYAWEVGMNTGNWFDANGARVGSQSPWSKTTGYRQVSFAGDFPSCQL
jgi:hypothetical protein